MKYFVTKNKIKAEHLSSRGFSIEGINKCENKTYYQFLDTKELREEVKKYIYQNSKYSL